MKQYPYFQHLAQLMALIELYKYFVPKVNILRPTNEGERVEWLKDSNGGLIDSMFCLRKGPFIMKIIPNLSLICSLLFFTHTAKSNTVLCRSSMYLDVTSFALQMNMEPQKVVLIWKYDFTMFHPIFKTNWIVIYGITLTY